MYASDQPSASQRYMTSKPFPVWLKAARVPVVYGLVHYFTDFDQLQRGLIGLVSC